jgi:hypothetical protein
MSCGSQRITANPENEKPKVRLTASGRRRYATPRNVIAVLSFMPDVSTMSARPSGLFAGRHGALSRIH